MLYGRGPRPLFADPCSMQSTASKTFSLVWIIFEKTLHRRGQLGLSWISPSNARESLFERMPTMKKDERRAQSANSSKVYRKPSAGFLKRGPRPPLGDHGAVFWGPRAEAFTHNCAVILHNQVSRYTGWHTKKTVITKNRITSKILFRLTQNFSNIRSSLCSRHLQSFKSVLQKLFGFTGAQKMCSKWAPDCHRPLVVVLEPEWSNNAMFGDGNPGSALHRV